MVRLLVKRAKQLHGQLLTQGIPTQEQKYAYIHKHYYIHYTYIYRYGHTRKVGEKIVSHAPQIHVENMCMVPKETQKRLAYKLYRRLGRMKNHNKNCGKLH